MGIAEFVYTTLCRPPLIKAAVNKLILALLPTSVRVNDAVVMLNPRDPVVSGALMLGVYERDEIAFMQEAFRSGQVMLDIGANVGLYTALGGSIIGRTGRIFAFEPDPQSLEFLHKTVKANYLVNTTVVGAAASNKNGSANLYVTKSNRGDNRLYPNDLSIGSLPIKTMKLDDYLEGQNIRQVDVIKIDVQGFEGQVVEGLLATLKRSFGVKILMEFWPQGLLAAGTEPIELLQRLEGLGLSINELLPGGKFQPIENKMTFIARYPNRAYTNLVVLGSELRERKNADG
jgi:FkbM family methyltransferase